MKYTYIPQSFDESKILTKFANQEAFLQTQIKYKTLFEQYLATTVDFVKMERIIQGSGLEIPKIAKRDNNFYYFYSSLGSEYFFVRNNYHVENLTQEEIMELQSGRNITEGFLKATFQKVLFEEGDKTFFGIPRSETMAKSKSLVLEFAYNQKKCTTISQLNSIEELSSRCLSALGKEIEGKLGIECSFLTNNGMNDLFSSNDHLLEESQKLI